MRDASEYKDEDWQPSERGVNVTRIINFFGNIAKRQRCIAVKLTDHVVVIRTRQQQNEKSDREGTEAINCAFASPCSAASLYHFTA